MTTTTKLIDKENKFNIEHQKVLICILTNNL